VRDFVHRARGQSVAVFSECSRSGADLDAGYRGVEGRDRSSECQLAEAGKGFRRQLAKVIKGLRRKLDTLSKLGPGYVEELSKLREIIDALHERWCDLQYHADFHEGATFHKREFMLNALLLWDYCGGKIAFSRDKDSGTPTGPLKRYLSLVCNLVMGEKAPALETLAAFIQRNRS
jgi:hypothetical protein